MRFALWEMLSVASPPPAPEREVLPAPPAANGDERLEPEALAIMAAEFRRLREHDQALHRRQAESLESAAEALRRLADGQQASAAARDGEGVEPLRAELAARDEELRSLREAEVRAGIELAAVREELHQMRVRADRDARRLTSAQTKLQRIREELAFERLSWWERRRRGLPRR